MICTLNKSITFALKFRTKRNQAYEFVYLSYYSYYYFYFGKKVEWEFVCMK